MNVRSWPLTAALTKRQRRQLSGEDRSRQPVVGAAVYDPQPPFAARRRRSAAQAACIYKCSISYSITSSAMERTPGGKSMPSAPAEWPN
jgi:hypothetical protein